MKRLLPFLFLLIPCVAQAQNARFDDIAFKGTNPSQFAAGATITVCTSSGVGLPCAPTVAGLCSSTSDVTCNQPASFTADGVGNFGFWIQPGRYVVSVTGSGLAGFSKTLTLACQLASTCTFTGSIGASIVNKQITVGPGLTYTTIASAMASSDCPASGCTINVRPDATLDTSAISLNKAGVHIVFDAGSYSYTGTTGLFNCNAQIAGIRISGANRGSTVGATQGTVINITNTAASFVAASNTQGCPGLELEHMSIIGPGSGTGVGLQLTGTRMKLSDLLVASFGGNGVTVDGSVNNTNLGVCIHSRFQGNGGMGMLLTGVNSDGWVFNSCDWAGNTGDGWVCDGTSKFSTFQGSNADSNVSGTGIHIKNCAQNVGDVFVDSATNNVVMDAASSSNWLRLIGGAPVTDAGSGNRTLGNTNLPLYGWNTLDMYTANFFGVTSGRVTLTPNAVVGGSFTATLPGATGTLAYNPPAATGTDLGSTALPWANLWLGTAATNNFKFQPAATAAARVVSIPDPGTAVNLAFNLTATSAAFATATTAATCVQNTTAVAGATTAMVAEASPVSTPGVGAVWSAFVSSAGNVTINECAVAASAGGSIAFNIRVHP